MGAIANWLARRLWWGMLWFIRRPLIKAWQRKAFLIVAPVARPRFRESLLAQNRFARRYGLGILTFMLTLALGSAAITATYFLALDLINSGFFVQPEKVQ